MPPYPQGGPTNTSRISVDYGPNPSLQRTYSARMLNRRGSSHDISKTEPPAIELARESSAHQTSIRAPAVPGAHPSGNLIPSESESGSESSSGYSEEEYERSRRARARDSRLLSSSPQRRPSIKRQYITAPTVTTVPSSESLRGHAQSNPGLDRIPSSGNLDLDRNAHAVVDRPRTTYTSSSRSSRRPSISTTASSGRSKGTTMSSVSGSQMILEDRKGRRVSYISKTAGDSLLSQSQQFGPSEQQRREAEIEAYQDSVRDASLSELTSENIRKHQQRKSNTGSHKTSRSSPTVDGDGFKIESGGTVIHVYGDSTVKMQSDEEGGPTQLVIGSASDKGRKYHSNKARSQYSEARSLPDADMPQDHDGGGRNSGVLDASSSIPSRKLQNAAGKTIPNSTMKLTNRIRSNDAAGEAQSGDANDMRREETLELETATSQTQQFLSNLYFGTSRQTLDASDATIFQKDSQLPFDTPTEVYSMRLAMLFAREISDNLGAITTYESMTASIAALLFDYTSLLNSRANLGIQQRAALFVCHRSHLIAEYLARTGTDVKGKEEVPDSQEKLSSLWQANFDGTKTPKVESGLSGIGDDHEDGTNGPTLELPKARAFLTESVEFSWLLSRIKVVSLMSSTSELSLAIRRTLLDTIVLGELYMEIPLLPQAFLREQYPSVERPRISDVICVVGQRDRAYATTCRDYVVQMWPLLGEVVIRALDATVLGAVPSGSHHGGLVSFCLQHRKFADLLLVIKDATLTITLEQSQTVIEAKSPSTVCLVEIGEVFTWLSAACRDSGEANKIALCVPSLEPTWGAFRGRCTMTNVPDQEPDVLGTEMCWHRIFNNPVITEGYPIPRRTQEERGLQISLDIMTTLACTQRATMYEGTLLLLKGLCSMFVPVLKAGSSIVWHYLMNEDLSWISHDAAKQYCSTTALIDSTTLSECTHYVGWTREADLLTGEYRSEKL